MIETQSGAAMYRQHATARHVIEYQPGPRLRWRTHSRWCDADEAQAALWRLARGEQVETRPEGTRQPNTAQEA